MLTCLDALVMSIHNNVQESVSHIHGKKALSAMCFMLQEKQHRLLRCPQCAENCLHFFSRHSCRWPLLLLELMATLSLPEYADYACSGPQNKSHLSMQMCAVVEAACIEPLCSSCRLRSDCAVLHASNAVLHCSGDQPQLDAQPSPHERPLAHL